MNNEELRRLRKGKRFTQAQLAKEIGCSRFAIIAWEAGDHPVPDTMAAKVLDICLTMQDPKPVDSSTAEDKEALKAYRRMRADTFTHRMVIELWHKAGFTPSAKAQDMIIAAFPDIMNKDQ